MSARVYQVWRVDCDCGSVVEYGEDEGSVPAECEDCGQEVSE